MSKVRLRDLTNNPNLWKAYWGNHQAGDEAGDAEILDNRNACAEVYGLAKITGEPNTNGTFLDHLEAYKAKDGRVIVFFSPYAEEDYVLKDVAKVIGFEKYAKMYHPKAMTYIKVFASRVEMNRAFRIAIKQMRSKP